MGTSQSSTGAPSGVPIVPPWVAELNNSDETDNSQSHHNDENERPDDGDQEKPIDMAPPARFKNSRISINKFARNGYSSDLRRGVGQYIKTGYGGTKSATKRFGQTAITAGVLYNVLSFGESDKITENYPDLDLKLLKGKSSEEVTDAIIEAVRPVDGTLDSEASRESIKSAFSELLEQEEDADLLDLSDEQKIFIVEKFIGGDVFLRFDLDLGKGIRKNAPTPAIALERLKEAKEYIRETVSASFRKLVTRYSINSRKIAAIVKETLQDALHVFESYAE